MSNSHNPVSPVCPWGFLHFAFPSRKRGSIEVWARSGIFYLCHSFLVQEAIDPCHMFCSTLLYNRAICFTNRDSLFYWLYSKRKDLQDSQQTDLHVYLDSTHAFEVYVDQESPVHESAARKCIRGPCFCLFPNLSIGPQIQKVEVRSTTGYYRNLVSSTGLGERHVSFFFFFGGEGWDY